MNGNGHPGVVVLGGVGGLDFNLGPRDAASGGTIPHVATSVIHVVEPLDVCALQVHLDKQVLCPEVWPRGIRVPVGGLIAVNQGTQFIPSIDEHLVETIVVIVGISNLPCTVTRQLTFRWIGHHIGDERILQVGFVHLSRDGLYVPYHAE